MQQSAEVSRPSCLTVVLLYTTQAEATGIRQRLNEARSLRDTSSPEFDEKMKQMKQLQVGAA